MIWILPRAGNWPAMFAGLATLPAQDVGAAIAELERAVTTLGLKGAELDTVMQGHTWDEPQFLPLLRPQKRWVPCCSFTPSPRTTCWQAAPISTAWPIA